MVDYLTKLSSIEPSIVANATALSTCYHSTRGFRPYGGMEQRNVLSKCDSPSFFSFFGLSGVLPQGTKGTNGDDANEAAFPLYKLPKSEWWSEFIKLIVAIDR
jgi:hypothetical protein